MTALKIYVSLMPEMVQEVEQFKELTGKRCTTEAIRSLLYAGLQQHNLTRTQINESAS
jgi:metal-responsive CopG/Arc/MetJ family transcriptional regulator